MGSRMRSAILRLSGADWDPAEAVLSIGRAPNTLWRKGERQRGGSPHEDSGCSFLVSRAEDAPELTSDVQQFFRTNGPLVAEFTSGGVEADLDIGVTVGTSKQYTASVSFEPDDLKTFAELRVRLTLSAYPMSDEARSPGR